MKCDYMMNFIPCIEEFFIEDLFYDNNEINCNRNYLIKKYSHDCANSTSIKLKLIDSIKNYLQNIQHNIIGIIVDNNCYCQTPYNNLTTQSYTNRTFKQILNDIEQKLNMYLDEKGYFKNQTTEFIALYHIYKKPHKLNNKQMWRIARNLYITQLDLNYMIMGLINNSFTTIGNYGIIDCIFRDFVIHLNNVIDDGNSKSTLYKRCLKVNFRHRFPSNSYKKLSARLNSQIEYFNKFPNQTEIITDEIEDLTKRKNIIDNYEDNDITYLSSTADWLLYLRNKYAGHDVLNFNYMITLRQYRNDIGLFVDDLQNRYNDILSFCREQYLVPKHYLYDNDYYHPDNKNLNVADHFDTSIVSELLTQLKFPALVIKAYQYGKSFNARLHYTQINCIEYNIKHNTNYYINKVQLVYLENLTSIQQFSNIILEKKLNEI